MFKYYDVYNSNILLKGRKPPISPPPPHFNFKDLKHVRNTLSMEAIFCKRKTMSLYRCSGRVVRAFASHSEFRGFDPAAAINHMR